VGAASLFLVSAEVFIIGKSCQTSSWTFRLEAHLSLEAKISIRSEKAAAPGLRHEFI
jgi:hypothetical protein